MIFSNSSATCWLAVKELLWIKSQKNYMSCNQDRNRLYIRKVFKHLTSEGSSEMHCFKAGVQWSQRDKTTTNGTIHVSKCLNILGVTRDMFCMKSNTKFC